MTIPSPGCSLSFSSKCPTFGLNQPVHGSDIARGLTTSARVSSNNWGTNEEMHWIGNAVFAYYRRIYTYEGTGEINILVVGRAITGRSAFTK